MLAYILAIAVGMSSLALFLAAFFRPKLHRQDDFLWSGIGLFYALVLWLCAEQLRGGLLLGQIAAASLALTFGWQTLKLRWAIANPESIAQIESFSLLAWLKNRIGKPPAKKQPSVPPTKPEVAVTPVASTPTTEEISTMPQAETTEEPVAEEIIEQITVSVQPSDVPSSTPKEETKAAVQPPTTTASAVKSAKPTKEGFSLKKLFSRGKPTPEPKTPTAKPTSITTALDLEESEPESDRVDEAASVSSTSDATIATSQPATEVEAYATYEEVEAETTEVESAKTIPESDLPTAEISPTVDESDESEPTNNTDSSAETENKPENLPPPSEI